MKRLFLIVLLSLGLSAISYGVSHDVQVVDAAEAKRIADEANLKSAAEAKRVAEAEAVRNANRKAAEEEAR